MFTHLLFPPPHLRGPSSSHGRCAGKGRGGHAGGVLPSGASWRVPDGWTRGTPGVSSPGAQSQPAGGPLGTQGRWVPDAARGGTGAGKVLRGRDPRGGWALRGEGREEAGGCSRQREPREPRPSQRQPVCVGPGGVDGSPGGLQDGPPGLAPLGPLGPRWLPLTLPSLSPGEQRPPSVSALAACSAPGSQWRQQRGC